MKKIIIITSVLLTTSCGMFSNMTKEEQKLSYELDKLWLNYSYERDSLVMEYYKKQ